ncbi:single hybrid motif-containing protein [Ramaria rubella]|nr:single hybrid motif-containing protein [Ramaria rubella]
MEDGANPFDTQMTSTVLHATSYRSDITKFQMPAMSPTMTEGGISDWKKKEGESFSAGDVLLEIIAISLQETDKATIDVEAQDDGVMGKIIAQNGAKGVPVGTTIALLAQEGDDISNLELPTEEPKAQPSSIPPAPLASVPSPAAAPQPFESNEVHIDHNRPIFPSVLRLLHENGVSDVGRIKGTGIRGMLTKGDVLAFFGKASSPNGTFKDNTPTPSKYKSHAVIGNVVGAPPIKKALDAAGIRRAILMAFLANSTKNRTPAPPSPRPTVDSIIADYLHPTAPSAYTTPSIIPLQTAKSEYLDGLY